jgi:hypothetical protein
MSTISSSTTSTTAFGVTADTTGALVIQTGATPTTAMTIDTSQNVGIGTASPADKLHVAISSGSLGGVRIQNTNAGGQSAVSYYNDAGTQKADVWWNNSGSTLNLRTLSTDPMILYTNNTERMRVNAGAPILCLAGGSTTATGTGIAFPATQSASTDANTLDDYEEGTWTPTSGVALSQYFTAQYVKVGRLVVCSFDVGFASSASGTAAVISGLPFNPAVTDMGSLVTGYTSYAYILIGPCQTTGFVQLYGQGGVPSANPSYANLSGARLMGTITYQTAT